ncbi:integrase [Candidatus Magnetomorum sp. HK-1]|nr:integrase [Candidatus Magnetomorum sp. HK-1]
MPGKTKVGRSYIYSGKKRTKITITYLDIKIDKLRQSGLLDQYRRKHNENAHYFSERGQVTRFVPQNRFSEYMSKVTTIKFNPKLISNFMRYGFDKIKAKVTKGKNIRYNNQDYYVINSTYKFSTQVSTQVKISEVNDKLLIFEDKKDGIFLGEALPTQRKTKSQSELTNTNKSIKANEIEQMSIYLESKGMVINSITLIEEHKKGLTFQNVIKIYEINCVNYNKLAEQVNDKSKIGFALFNGFIIDCGRYQSNNNKEKLK